MKRLGFILVSLLLCVYGTGQEFAIEHVIEKIYGQLMETNESDIDYSDLYDELIAFYENPINLNNTTPDQLAQLRFLSDIQIENFSYYIYKVDSMRTIYELQLVEGMDLFTIQMLLPFVTVGSAHEAAGGWNFRDVMR
ncbi:MAG TPA: helix-hairpin-helix domain-containing protein, partial [Paludibacteraceae bacterium]|nr:helix-hairpin-helix domain-containing protein [Paludibacteraceae bacterium]